MQVKVFESEDMASGLKMVKKELGPDALILSTRTVKNGKLGLLGKPMLEITAAIDTTQPSISNSTHSFSVKEPAMKKRRVSGFSCVVDDTFSTQLPGQNQQYPVQSDERTAGESRPNGIERAEDHIRSEVNELKDLIKDLAREISKISTSAKSSETVNPKGLQVSRNFSGNKMQQIQGDHILSMLINRGINVESSRTIASFLRESLTEQELCREDLVRETIVETIQGLIEVSPPDFNSLDGQHIMAFVGPTGVGKTTTLAKIAAFYLAGYSRSIALITIDTYRIAAVEQLKVYGEIMHLPVDVVITPDQLEQAIEKHRDKELILIDTAGRSPRDEFCIEELSTFLHPQLNIEKHLVLSATTREQELLETIRRFDPLGISNTIFTKIDECTNLGILLNIQIQNSNPLSYVTNGQRVPEDLLEISQKKVAELIMSQHEGPMHG